MIQGDDDQRLLIERAAQGDHRAFEMIYRQNIDDVMAFLARRVPATVAEDLAAETFIRAFRRLDAFVWTGVPIRAWLLRIAYRELVARWRRSSSHEQPIADAPDRPAHRPHDRTDPEHAMLVTEDAAELATALRSLPELQRLAIELRHLCDFTVAEAAVVLDISEEAVRAATYRGLRTLKDNWAVTR